VYEIKPCAALHRRCITPAAGIGAEDAPASIDVHLRAGVARHLEQQRTEALGEWVDKKKPAGPLRPITAIGARAGA